MPELIAGVTPFDALVIGLKAVTHGVLLVAAGSILTAVMIDGVPLKERRFLHGLAAALAPVIVVALTARLMLEAVFLAGNDWSAVLDTSLLGLLATGSLGQVLGLQAVGALLLTGALRRGVIGVALALLGVGLIVGAYGIGGHVRNTASNLDNALLMVHTFCLAFWLGVFLPLERLSREPGDAAARVADDFGHKAPIAVGLLVVAGALTLQQLTGGVAAALQTPYGQLFALKLGVFAGVLGLAAMNKRHHTPALIAGQAGARQRLRGSVRLEALFIAIILLVSATFTTLTGPSG